MAGRLHSGRARDEGGYTLVELLVAVSLMLVLVAAGMGLLIVSNHTQPRITERSTSLQQGRVLIDRITRELRQGVGIPTAPTPPAATMLSVLTYVQASACGSSQSGDARQCRVTYECASGTCTRTERNPDGTGSAPAVQVVEGLRSNDVFRYGDDDCADPPSAAAASFVRVCLEYPSADGGESVTLDDGAALRNAALVTP